jgi:hypothetical protein
MAAKAYYSPTTIRAAIRGPAIQIYEALACWRARQEDWDASCTTISSLLQTNGSA